ncbi:hypothetical protein [Brasilonema sp. UFV-L1]|uniref:hypothetical protein n=1 Tax=Brasilonema sp. UFV-L1 TaxID=2234130 RepID=UPI00145ECB7C|nr:hypothetical protein [Brasilonema sp. UFV-L1]NMG11260.1 hypothetical protein [Brasilonema sp. UFV-L1]
MVEGQLRKIIDKYSEDKTDYAIARRMAEITLEEYKNNYNERDYKEALTRKVNGYKSNLCHYKSGKKKPRTEMLLLISKAIGCSQEELEAIFNPQDYTDSKDNGLLIENNESEAEGSSFRFLEVESKAIFFENGSLEWSKSFKIECLEENLQTLKELDFYECVGEPVRVDCQDERFDLERDRDYLYKESFISAHFHEPLKKGQEIDLTINYSCSKVHETDRASGATWVLHPTELLKIDYTPPNRKKSNMQAKMYKHENRGSYLGLWHEQRTELGNISLSESCSFRTEIENPCLYALYEIYWGR